MVEGSKMCEWQILFAHAFAAGAHAAVGQLRKYTLDPYIVHPSEVAEIVKSVPHTPEMVQAAYLHDTVEDTGVTLIDIGRHFGPTVMRYVDGLTERKTPEGSNRAFRKALDAAWLSQQCREVQTIKLADLISNTQSIVRYDPKFAKVYLKEKEALLLVMTKGDETLTKKAWQILKDGLNQLEQVK